MLRLPGIPILHKHKLLTHVTGTSKALFAAFTISCTGAIFAKKDSMAAIMCMLNSILIPWWQARDNDKFANAIAGGKQS
jgi:hypothetical protein